MDSPTRRDFLKSSVAGAAGLAVGSKAHPANAAKGAWQPGTNVNPSIDNLRAVVCHDESMIGSDNGTIPTDFDEQNAAVDTQKVHENMDRMAMALARKGTAAEAWGTIFQEPAKGWAQSRAAIKVNCIASHFLVRLAVVDKVCRELIDLGIEPGNITIYDADHKAYGKYASYVGNGLPDNVHVQTNAEAGMRDDMAYGSYSWSCTNLLYKNNGGTPEYPSDILVNCAINKGHSQNNKGGFTLTMKNHVGSMKFSCPSLNEMIAMNMSDAILGGTPTRQQLCIVDSIWAMKDGPTGNHLVSNHRLAMSTFGPVLDYLVATRIREPVDIMDMNNYPNSSYHINHEALDTILESFGYDPSSEEIRNLDFVDAADYVQARRSLGASPRGSSLTVEFRPAGGAYRMSRTTIRLPSLSTTPRITITDPKGRVVRRQVAGSAGAGATTLSWDGRDERGRQVGAGTYLVTCREAPGVVGRLTVRR